MPKSTEDLYKELLAQGQQYQQQANDLLSQYDSRGAFSYDPQNDPGFQALKNQYVHQGQRAMQDTMGQAAGLTGGYGSTYAQSAGNQAYNEYLTQLNAQIPALQQQARAAWDAEGQRMLDRYNLALNQANTAYGQGRDALGDLRYEQEYADDMAYRQWQMQQAEQDRQDSLNKASQDRAYQMVMQMISTGQTPSAELLAQAGVSADYARSMANYYRQQAALAMSGGGSGSSRTSNPSKTPKKQTDPNTDPYKEPSYTAADYAAAGAAQGAIYAANAATKGRISDGDRNKLFEYGKKYGPQALAAYMDKNFNGAPNYWAVREWLQKQLERDQISRSGGSGKPNVNMIQ